MASVLPQIEIHFESIIDTESELLRNLQKNGLQTDKSFNVIKMARECLYNAFVTAFNDLNILVQPFIHSKIILLVHQFQSEEHKNILAYFNIYRSKPENNEFYFGVYYPIILHYIYELNGIEHDYFPEIKSVWQHEMIHMTDYKEILLFKELYSDDNKDNESDSWVFNRFFNLEKIDENKISWKLMFILNNFRNEGIPVLYEILSGYNRSDIYNVDDAIMKFNFVFAYIKSTIASSSFSSYAQLNEMNKMLTDFHSISYQIGPWIVLNALKNSHNQSISGIAKKGLASITSHISLNNNEILELIKYAQSQDIGGYIYLNSNFADNQQWFFDIDGILSLCNLFGEVFQNVNNAYEFCKRLLFLSKKKDTEKFIAEIKEVIGFPMSFEEIEAEFRQFEKSPEIRNSVASLVEAKTKVVYEHYLQNQDMVSQMVLTYIFDPEDLLDDSIHFIGYLDDLCVLKAWEELLKDG